MRTERRYITAVALSLAVGPGACTNAGEQNAGRDRTTAGAAATASGDTGGMAGMNGMKGMEGTSGMPGMAEGGMAGMSGEMHTHMMAMTGAPADSMKRMLPMHRQMVANMIAKMNGEMRDMQMAGDAGWAATVDSLRKDLVRLPELANTELTAMMPAHMARITRLNDMHQQMMRAMSAK